MMHRAWSSIEEVPYCFSRSYVKFQGHTALKIVEFDPNRAFPDCNSSLNSPMAMKCCTKLETAKERCPIVFQGHPSNFKVTRYKTSPILTQIGRFRTIGRSQLSNPSDLPCFFLHLSLLATLQNKQVNGFLLNFQTWQGTVMIQINCHAQHDGCWCPDCATGYWGFVSLAHFGFEYLSDIWTLTGLGVDVSLSTLTQFWQLFTNHTVQCGHMDFSFY